MVVHVAMTIILSALLRFKEIGRMNYSLYSILPSFRYKPRALFELSTDW
jgi:hypothetical protein